MSPFRGGGRLNIGLKGRRWRACLGFLAAPSATPWIRYLAVVVVEKGVVVVVVVVVVVAVKGRVEFHFGA